MSHLLAEFVLDKDKLIDYLNSLADNPQRHSLADALELLSTVFDRVDTLPPLEKLDLNPIVSGADISTDHDSLISSPTIRYGVYRDIAIEIVMVLQYLFPTPTAPAISNFQRRFGRVLSRKSRLGPLWYKDYCSASSDSSHRSNSNSGSEAGARKTIEGRNANTRYLDRQFHRILKQNDWDKRLLIHIANAVSKASVSNTRALYVDENAGRQGKGQAPSLDQQLLEEIKLNQYLLRAIPAFLGPLFALPSSSSSSLGESMQPINDIMVVDSSHDAQKNRCHTLSSAWREVANRSFHFLNKLCELLDPNVSKSDETDKDSRIAAPMLRYQLFFDLGEYLIKQELFDRACETFSLALEALKDLPTNKQRSLASRLSAQRLQGWLHASRQLSTSSSSYILATPSEFASSLAHKSYYSGLCSKNRNKKRTLSALSVKSSSVGDSSVINSSIELVSPTNGIPIGLETKALFDMLCSPNKRIRLTEVQSRATDKMITNNDDEKAANNNHDNALPNSPFGEALKSHAKYQLMDQVKELCCSFPMVG